MNFFNPRPWAGFEGEISQFEGFIYNITPAGFLIISSLIVGIAIVEIVDRIRGGNGVFF
jgi:hypothetical protein